MSLFFRLLRIVFYIVLVACIQMVIDSDNVGFQPDFDINEPYIVNPNVPITDTLLVALLRDSTMTYNVGKGSNVELVKSQDGRIRVFCYISSWGTGDVWKSYTQYRDDFGQVRILDHAPFFIDDDICMATVCEIKDSKSFGKSIYRIKYFARYSSTEHGKGVVPAVIKDSLLVKRSLF